MSYIFLSYATANEDVARTLCAAFEQADLEVRTPAILSPGDSLSEGLSRLIEEAVCVVVLWSAAAATSLWVRREVQAAIHAWSTDRLILVVLDDTELPVGVRDLVAFDLSTDRDDQIKKIVDCAKSIRCRQRLSSHNHIVTGDKDRWYAEEERRRCAEEEKRNYTSTPIERNYTPIDQKSYGKAPSKRWNILFQIIVLMVVGIYWGITITKLPIGIPNLPTEIPDGSPLPGSKPIPPQSFFAPTDLWLGAIIGSVILLSIGITILAARRRRSKKAILPHQDSTVRTGTHHVFVSYSQRDIKFVRKIVQHIKEAGFSVWIDQKEGGHSGQRYAAPIVRAIESSQLVALMCSHNAFTSDHVVREVYVAGDFKKPFIVFLLDQTTFPAEFLYFLSGFPRIPARGLKLEELQSEIRRHICKSAAG